jgi:hypothetical protein
MTGGKGLRMFEPAGRVCEDPPGIAGRSEGARQRVRFLAFFFVATKKKVARRGRVPGQCDIKHRKSAQ